MMLMSTIIAAIAGLVAIYNFVQILGNPNTSKGKRLLFLAISIFVIVFVGFKNLKIWKYENCAEVPTHRHNETDLIQCSVKVRINSEYESLTYRGPYAGIKESSIGKVTFHDGSVFIGPVLNARPHGEGELKTKNGTRKAKYELGEIVY